MNFTYKRLLLAAGTDLDSTLDRFMNDEDLYEKFLVKFLQDKNFVELKKNLELKNYEEAFVNAHTLKGVSANLGLDSIYNVLVSLVEELRNNNYSENNYEFKLLEENYDEICMIIKENSSILLTP